MKDREQRQYTNTITPAQCSSSNMEAKKALVEASKSTDILPNDDTEEKKVDPSNSSLLVPDYNNYVQQSIIQCPAPDNPDCDDMLETIDSCVGFMEGITMQHRFEDAMIEDSIKRQQIAAANGLSEAEATMIRQQITAGASSLTRIGTQLPSLIMDLDLDRLCGADEALPNGTSHCGVTPSDTTVDSAIAGDRPMPVEPRQQSLVDVANDDSQLDLSILGSDQRCCAICMDQAMITSSGSHSPRKISFVHFPCCNDNSVLVCTACVLVLTTATSNGLSRVGRCPNCRQWIAATTLHSPTADLVVSKLDSPGQCSSCLQEEDVIVESNPNICDACFLGNKQSFTYECRECEATQPIPYPMYRYQPAPQEFGNRSWSCQNEACKKTTFWKLCPNQRALIPAGDIPAAWGADGIELAKEKVKEARKSIAKLNIYHADGSMVGVKHDNCIIL